MKETTQNKRPLSLGEERVRVNFNRSQSDVVDSIKEDVAKLINLLEKLKEEGKDPRLASLAQTAFEEACMWAVKAATS